MQQNLSILVPLSFLTKGGKKKRVAYYFLQDIVVSNWDNELVKTSLRISLQHCLKRNEYA